MATPFPFGSGNVLTAAQMNAITTLPINDQTASYVALVGDVGKRIVMNVATANTVTINNSVFGVGDEIFIACKGAGSTTVTAGAGVTINTSSSLVLAQHGGGTLVALSASVFAFFSQQAATYGTFTGGTALATPPAGYTGAAFTSDGTMTVTKAGLFEVLAIGGGGGGGANPSGSVNGTGGGGGGGVTITTVYLAAGSHTVVVGAGGAQDLNGRSTSIDANVVNAVGGGRGGGCTSGAQGWQPGSGGSGGGTFYNNGTLILGYAFTGLGNNGGLPVINTAGSGGGGFSAVGGAGAVTTGGAGGAGYDIATFTGNASTLKAAGGGGGGTVTGGAGGSSVGGAGGGGGGGVAASANTASGGGGGGGASTLGGAGGSGFIAIRVKP